MKTREVKIINPGLEDGMVCVSLLSVIIALYAAAINQKAAEGRQVCKHKPLPVQEVWGYQPCLWKMVLVGAGAVCSGGLLLLLLYWLPEWGVKSTCTPTSLKEAHTLLLRTRVGDL